MPPLNEILVELFQAHGVEASLQDEWVVFPGREMRANAEIVREIPQQGGMSVQLDVRLEIAPGQMLVESFGGIGATRDQAVGDAIQNLVNNSFHVLLVAFFQPGDDHVEQETWEVGGSTTRAILGNAGVRGRPSLPGEQLVGWFDTFTDKIKTKYLVPGTHWIRLYYCQAERKAMMCEVLLDNEPWEALQEEMSAISWPTDDAFYSVRVFLVLHVEDGTPPTPERAVAHLAEIIAPQTTLSDDAIDAAMVAAGFPLPVAHRAYQFTQLAWGRIVLRGLPITTSPDYFCLDANGKIAESGQLRDERYFAAAYQIGPRYSQTSGFKQLALFSADINAVNNALNAGSKPEDLKMAPAFIFLESPTPAGLATAQQTIAEQVARLRPLQSASTPPSAPPAKKWWRFGR